MDQSTQRTRRVLIVDPFASTAASLETIFMRAGYEARSATDEETALTVAIEFSPDLAILELLLSKTTGPEFSIRLCEVCPGCSVLFLCAQAGDAVHDEARALGWQVLAKPAHPELVLERAGRLLGRSAGAYSSFK